MATKADKPAASRQSDRAAATGTSGSHGDTNNSHPLSLRLSKASTGSQDGAGSHGDGNSTFPLVADITDDSRGSHGGTNNPFPLVALTSRIVSAHLSGNSVASADLPELVRSVHGALQALTAPSPPTTSTPAALKPAVPIRSSVKHDHIVCLEDGRKLKVLTRHLRSAFDLSPKQYRAKWGLPADYPMTAPAFSERRREVALATGLGRKASATSKKRGKRA